MDYLKSFETIFHSGYYQNMIYNNISKNRQSMQSIKKTELLVYFFETSESLYFIHNQVLSKRGIFYSSIILLASNYENKIIL